MAGMTKPADNDFSMNRAYWDSVAEDYDRAVLSVFDHDPRRLVASRIKSASEEMQGEGRAADLGCGVVKFLPLLANAFKEVEACDFSPRSLEQARARCRSVSNVTIRNVDLASERLPFEPVDFVLCVNVLIMPELDERLRAWRAVTNQVARGGMLLLIVPSLESAQMEVFRDLAVRLDEGQSCAEAIRAGRPPAATVDHLQFGVRTLNGQPTKHYLRVELASMLSGHEFDVAEIVELAYPSEAEGVAPGAWDWLALARRR